MIEQLDLCAETFTDKTTVFYGPTESGKSFFMRAVLYLLSKTIEQIVVFCPTDLQNGQYSADMVPRPLVISQLTPEKLNNIIDRQEMLVTMVKAANKMIKALFDKVDASLTSGARRAIDGLYNKLEDRKAKIMMGVESDEQKEMAHLNNMRVCEELADKIRKDAIKEYTAHLFGKNLSKDEANSLRWMFTNPKIVLVFDDCTPELSAMKSDQVIKKIFMQGRWAGVTALIAAHTDKMLDPEIKKGVFINIFSHPASVREYFERSSNNIDKETKKRAVDANREIFATKYQKFIYFRDGRIAKGTASWTPAFRFGNQSIWDFCNQVQSEVNTDIPKGNRYYSEFVNV